jgi:predicted HAD superfamily Cof-like phosphohydrolase
MTQSYFADVADFHARFGFASERDLAPPAPLSADMVAYRGKFMLEELAEWFDAQGANHIATRLRAIMKLITAMLEAGDLNDAPASGMANGLDALVDLCYVAMGTAHFGRLPFDPAWAEVQRANMLKVPGVTKRGHALDVTKPPGWRGPEHGPLIEARRLWVTRKCYCIHEDIGHVVGSEGCLYARA